MSIESRRSQSQRSTIQGMLKAGPGQQAEDEQVVSLGSVRNTHIFIYILELSPAKKDLP